ncbi:hypothetical protein PSY81_24065, partial [Shigella flexneri]|nr:hypothetical protein [Shigella flexneri]
SLVSDIGNKTTTLKTSSTTQGNVVLLVFNVAVLLPISLTNEA